MGYFEFILSGPGNFRPGCREVFALNGFSVPFLESYPLRVPGVFRVFVLPPQVFRLVSFGAMRFTLSLVPFNCGVVGPVFRAHCLAGKGWFRDDRWEEVGQLWRRTSTSPSDGQAGWVGGVCVCWGGCVCQAVPRSAGRFIVPAYLHRTPQRGGGPGRAGAD